MSSQESDLARARGWLIVDCDRLMEVIAETHAQRDLTEITGPTDPDGPFLGRSVTLRRWRRHEVTPGMQLGGFVWPPFTWPVARTENLLSVWPVRRMTMQPVSERGWGGQLVYRGQTVTFYFFGDRYAVTGPAESLVWEVVGFGEAV